MTATLVAGNYYGIYCADSANHWTDLGGYYLNLINSTVFNVNGWSSSHAGCNVGGTYLITINDNIDVTDDSSTSYYDAAAAWNESAIASGITIVAQ